MPTFTLNRNFKKDVFKTLKFWIAYLCLCTIVSSKIAFGASTMILAGKLDQNVAIIFLKDYDASLNVLYTLERSTDGKNFEEIEKIMVSREKPSLFEFTFRDKTWHRAGAAKVYYRVRATDVEGWFDFSPVATVSEGNPGIVMQLVEKNDVAGLGILHTDVDKSPNSTLKIFDANGELLKEENVEGSHSWVELPKQIPGKYKIQLASAGRVVENELHLH